jgi:Flp pilus assembly protein TadB
VGLGTLEWLLIIVLTAFITMFIIYMTRPRHESVHDRISGMEVFTKGTDADRMMNQSLFKRIYFMLEERTTRYLDKYMRSGQMRPLKLKLIQANDHVTEPIQHWSKKIITTVGAFVFSILMFKGKILYIALVTFVGYYWWDMKLKKKVEQRQLKIKSELPDFLDLLAATAPSAKSLDDAIRKVCSRMNGEVTLEFRRTLEEINAGRKQRDALNDFAVRCGIAEINTLVSQLNQAEVFGTGVEKTLIVQAEKIRKLKKLLAEIRARQVAVLLLLPSMLLLMTVLLVIAGPRIVDFVVAMKGF